MPLSVKHRCSKPSQRTRRLRLTRLYLQYRREGQIGPLGSLAPLLPNYVMMLNFLRMQRPMLGAPGGQPTQFRPLVLQLTLPSSMLTLRFHILTRNVRTAPVPRCVVWHHTGLIPLPMRSFLDPLILSPRLLQGSGKTVIPYLSRMKKSGRSVNHGLMNRLTKKTISLMPISVTRYHRHRLPKIAISLHSSMIRTQHRRTTRDAHP